MSEFSRVLQFSLDMRKMNRAELADKIGCSRSTVHYWYTGQKLPTLDYVGMVANALNRDERLFYTALEDDMRKALGKDVSISEMLQLRNDGYSNKQIADLLDVSPATIYKYIGKRSDAVRHAQEQNKPCPVSGVITGYAKAERADDVIKQIRSEANAENDKPVENVVVAADTVIVPKPESTPSISIRGAANAISSGVFSALHTRVVTKLQGKACVYSVDSEAPYVELSDDNGGQIAGIIDFDMIPAIIAELKEIYAMKGVI